MGSRRAMRPLEARFDQLPDMTPVAPYPGMTSRIQTLCRSVTAARSSLEPWDIISATGRRIQIPRGKEDTPLCSAAVACALADLRDTVNGACTAFAWDEHGLWHLNASTDGYARWHPIASIQSECGITAAAAEEEETFSRLKEAQAHFMAVNGCTQSEYHAALGEANRVHAERSRREWVTDISKLKELL